jgi:hypothetical protein
MVKKYFLCVWYRHAEYSMNRTSRVHINNVNTNMNVVIVLFFVAVLNTCVANFPYHKKENKISLYTKTMFY